MPYWALFILLLVMTSCGGFKLFNAHHTHSEREIASIVVERLILEENRTFGAELADKLYALYSYHALAQNYLYDFDEMANKGPIKKLYQSGPYLKLLATKTQIDNIEKDILQVYREIIQGSSKSEIQKGLILLETIKAFSELSHLRALSTENLRSALLSKSHLPAHEITRNEFEEELKGLKDDRKFQIYEKNIEHLSHLLETDVSSREITFRPSELDSGSISGEEFPHKVWALTFNSGHSKDKTMNIVANLKKKKIRATFFRTGEVVERFPDVSLKVMDAGMEIASQSYSNKDLSKAGRLTLEKELVYGTDVVKKTLGIKVDFFRLPYAAGIDVPAIRQLIAQEGLIHVLWNVDSLDWPPQSADRIVARTKLLMKKSKKDSGIILFHEGHQRSVEASEKIMNFLLADDRRTCTIGRIVKEMNEGRKTVCSSNSLLPSSSRHVPQ